MRRINHVLTIVLMVLLEVHIVVCSFLMFGWSHLILEQIARIEFVLVMCHALIGILLTFKKNQFRSSNHYIEKNKLYWWRRVTGLGILVLSIPHMSMFVKWIDNSIVKMKFLSSIQMVSHVLFLLFIVVHLALNMKPMLISMGIKKYKRVNEVLLVISVVLSIFALVASILYYLR